MPGLRQMPAQGLPGLPYRPEGHQRRQPLRRGLRLRLRRPGWCRNDGFAPRPGTWTGFTKNERDRRGVRDKAGGAWALCLTRPPPGIAGGQTDEALSPVSFQTRTSPSCGHRSRRPPAAIWQTDCGRAGRVQISARLGRLSRKGIGFCTGNAVVFCRKRPDQVCNMQYLHIFL